MDGLIVETVDGEPLERDNARTLSKRVFYAGWLFLPWLWAVNVWMFWPDFRHGDAVVKAYTRRSAACFAGWCCLFLPWMVLFMAAGSSLLNASVYQKLDAYRLDLAAWGVGF